jgi:hypothetical protein
MMPAKFEPSDRVLKKMAHLKDDAKSSNKRVRIGMTVAKVSRTDLTQSPYFELRTLITPALIVHSTPNIELPRIAHARITSQNVLRWSIP